MISPFTHSKRFFRCFPLTNIISTICFFSLLSCGEMHHGISPETLVKRPLKPTEGLIVGSYEYRIVNHADKSWDPVVAQNVAAGSSHLTAKSSNSSGASKVWISNRWPSESASWLAATYGPKSRGDCFAIPVPAGDYEINEWEVTPFGGGVKFVNRLPIKVCFQVKAGQATDIGTVHEIILFEKGGLAGVPLPKAGIMLISDNHEKNVALISKKFPSIHKSQIIHSDVPKLFMLEMKRIKETPENWWNF